ncbi:MFS transporter [Streptomyces sp. NPDC012637]|uniref:MFS transporter n=1 Tax=Streptomyces sp. NPDC012637 TaxID=3364842 RepID=UPI0036E58BF5
MSTHLGTRRPHGMRRLLAGATTARTGDEMSGPALLLLGYAQTGSAATAAALLAGITASAALGGPVLGALLDRAARPGRLLAVSLVLHVAGLTVVLLTLGRVPFPLTLLTALAAGTLAPALAGGWTSQLSTVVPERRLHRAHALDAMTYSTASLLGPALAGLLGRLLGAPAAVVGAVVLILLAVPATRGLPHRQAPAEPVTVRSVARDLRQGFACLVRSMPLARATVTSTLSCLGQGTFVACVPLLGARALGAPGDGALLLSCTAVAALAAGAVLGWLRRPPAPDTVLWAAPLLLALALASALAAATAAHGSALLVAAALLAGVAEGPQLTALFAVRHREAPQRLRAQVFTTGASVKITAFALGAALAGPLASRSLTAALVMAAAVQLLAAAAHAVVGRAFVRRSGPATRRCGHGPGRV